MLKNPKKGDQISKNYQLGDEIKTFEEFVKLGMDKKAVFYKPAGIYLPAVRLLFMHRHYLNLYTRINCGDFIKLEKIKKQTEE